MTRLFSSTKKKENQQCRTYSLKLALTDIAEVAKEGLLAMSVTTGLAVMHELIELAAQTRPFIRAGSSGQALSLDISLHDF